MNLSKTAGKTRMREIFPAILENKKNRYLYQK